MKVIVSITKFVVVSSVGITRVDCTRVTDTLSRKATLSKLFCLHSEKEASLKGNKLLQWAENH